MPNPTQNASGAREILSSNIESRFELSQNYYQRLNTEYRMALLTGNLNSDSIREIESRTRPEDFQRTFADRFSRQAFEWHATRIFHRIANSWLGQMLGLQTAIRSVQERVMGTLTSPFHTVRNAVGEIRALPGLSSLDFSSPEALNRSQNVLGRLGRRGQLASDMLKVQQYLEQNPQVSANATEQDLTSEQFWNMVLDRADITENRPDIIQIFTGQKTAQEVFTALETTAPSTAEDTAGNLETNTERQLETESTTSESTGLSFTDPNYVERLSQYEQHVLSPTSVENPYSTRVNSILNYEEIESQYFLDQSRHRTALIYNQVRMFRNDNRALVDSALLAGAIYGVLNNPLNFSISKLTDNFSELVKLPFKIGPVPIAVVAALVGSIYLYAQSNPYMPRDPENFRRSIIEFMRGTEAWEYLEGQYGSRVEQYLNQAFEFVTDTEKFNEAISGGITYAQELVDSTVESLSDTPQRLINRRNIETIERLEINLSSQLNNLSLSTEERQEINNILQHTRDFKLSIRENSRLTPEIFSEFLTQLDSISQLVSIDEENDYYYWTLFNKENELIAGPSIFVINPTLNASEQFQVARRFTSLISDNRNLLSTSAEIWKDQLKLALGEIMQNFDRDRDLEDQLFNFLGTGGAIGLIGDTVYLLVNGGVQRIALGAVSFWWNGLKTLLGEENRETYGSEMLVDYAGNLLPVFAFTFTRDLFSSTRSIGPFGLKTIARTALFFLQGPYEAFNYMREVKNRLGTDAGRYRFRTPIDTLNRWHANINHAFYNLRDLPFIRNPIQLDISQRMSTFRNIQRIHSGYQRQLFEALHLQGSIGRGTTNITEALRNIDPKTQSMLDARLGPEISGQNDYTKAQRYLEIFTEDGRQSRTVSRNNVGRAVLLEAINSNDPSRIEQVLPEVSRDPLIRQHLNADGSIKDITALRDSLTQDSGTQRFIDISTRNAPRSADTTRPADADSTRAADTETPRPADTDSTRTTDTPPRSRARRYAGRGGAILGMLGLGAAAYKIGDHFQRDTAVRYDYNSPSIEVASRQETTEENAEEDPNTINERITEENNRLLLEYNQIIEHFSHNNLENINNRSEQELTQILQEMQEIHRQQTEKLSEFVSNNRMELKEILETNDIETIALGVIESSNFIYQNQLEQNFSIGQVKIDSDTNRLFLEHMSPDEFNRMFWDTVNTAKGTAVDQTLDSLGVESTSTTRFIGGATTIGAYMTPGIGTGLDFRDAYREARRGNIGEAAVSTIFGSIGLASDALLAASFLTAPVTGGGSAAAGVTVTTGFRGVLATARASRAARILRANRTAIGATSVATGGTSIATSTLLGIAGKRPFNYESRAYFN